MSLAEYNNWTKELAGRWLLWDTSAILRVLQYDAAEILDQYFDGRKPTTAVELDLAEKIQVAIGALGQPSPADLYLAATLARYPTNRIALVTENVSDFPKPYFDRLSYITLESDNNACTLSLLTTSKSRFE